MNAQSEIEPLLSSRRVTSILWFIIAASLSIHLVCLVAGRTFLKDVHWNHHPVHAALEISGALIACFVAVVLVLLERRGKGTSFNVWIAGALLGMGLLDGMHAFQHVGQEFVWLHSTATFVGGALFVLVWLPQGWSKRVGNWWPLAVSTTALVFGICSLIFHSRIPAMTILGEHGKVFTLWAQGLNIVGGLLLFAAAVQLVRTYRKTRNVDDLLFCLHCSLFGAAAIMFKQSELWDVPWWGWHILRLLAYGVALWFVILTELRTREEITSKLRDANLTLEERVLERTEQLAREQYLLSALVDNIPDPVFFKDGQGRLIRTNQAMADDTGFDDPSQLIGKTDVDLWSGDLPAETRADEIRIMESGEPIINKEEKLLRNGVLQQCVLVTKMPLRESGRIVGTFGIARDITDRKRDEIKLQETAAALAQANAALELSNEDLQQFASVASHDLQEPLRAVAGFSELLQKQYSGQLDQEADKYIDFMIDGVKRMQTLINNLLEYSRVGVGGDEFAPIDCRQVVDASLQNLSAAIEESGAEVKIHDLPTVIGDRAQLLRVFQNLIGNAIKFRGEAAPKIDISAQQADGEWQFAVRDNGIGIEQKYSSRIFTIFQRLHARTKYAGTGVGLSICQRIIQRHGGRIWVESDPGVGSTFFFTMAG